MPAAKTEAKPVQTFFLFIVVSAMIYGLYVYFTSGDGPSTAERRCQDTGLAFVMSQNFVKQALRSPSSASFPSATSNGVNVRRSGECEFQVRGYVDSQNAFGAVLRNNYSITMRYNPDSNRWSGSDLSFSD